MIRRHPGRTGLLAGFLLHTVTVLGVWQTYGELGRGNLIAYMDLPVSLFFLHLDGPPLLYWSLAAGGAQWAAVAGLLTLSLGWAARARQR